MSRLTKILAVLIVCSFATSLSWAVDCSQRGLTNKSTAVYTAPPRYVTGIGWQGEIMNTLPEGTQLYICECRDVEFGFSAKTWCRTAFKPGKDWQYGWILKEDLKDWSTGSRQEKALDVFSFVREAIAGEEQSADGPAWTLGTPPPDVPAPAKTNQVNVALMKLSPPGSSSGIGSTFSFSETLRLYWPLFLSMLLGMAAKAGVDLIYAGSKTLAMEHVRNAAVSILISPIVFLGFLNGGSFQATAQTFVVLCLVAFQNGFFWQTVLKRPVAEGIK